jgi:hypothetical protein
VHRLSQQARANIAALASLIAIYLYNGVDELCAAGAVVRR